jgi:muconolactone delta-isomerase
MEDDLMSLSTSHREYVNELIEQGIIDQYVVSMESQQVWITFTAESKEEVETHLSKSPIYSYWTYEVDELYIYDVQNYKLPAVKIN